MKKLLLLTVFILIILTMLAGCSDVRTLEFAESTIYVRSSTVFTPEIKIKPKKADYTLESGNPSIAAIEGKTVVPKSEGRLTLTVRSGEKTAEATLIISDSKDYEDQYTYTGDYYTVIFMDTENTQISSLDVAVGRAPSFPNYPAKPGYVIDGWYTTKELTEKFNFEVPLSGNTVVYGQWVLDTPLFSYETKDGKTLITGLAYSSVPYTVLDLPTKTNMGVSVDGLKEGAFKDNTTIKEVNVPSEYTELAGSAFYGCTALEKVTFGEESLLKKIGDNCFRECSALTDITLPDSLAEMGRGAFYYCTALEQLNLPSGLTVLQQYSLSHTALKSVDLTYVKALLEGVFDGTAALTEVKNTDALEIIYKYVLRGTAAYANSLVAADKDNADLYIINGIVFGVRANAVSVTMKASGVRMIADYAFSGAREDLVLTVDGDPLHIEICDYSGTGTQQVFKSGMTVIFEENYFFSARNTDNPWREYVLQSTPLVCRRLVDGDFTFFVYYASGENYYALYRFNRLSLTAHVDLTKLAYPVKIIKSGAFSTVENIKTLTLGDSVKTIESDAINGNTKLLSIMIDASSPATLVHATRSISKGSNASGGLKIFVPTAALRTYKNAWSSLSGILHTLEGVGADGLCIEKVGPDHAEVIRYHGDGETVIIPETVTINGEELKVEAMTTYSLWYNASVKRLVVCANMQYLDSKAIAGNSSLEEIQFLGEPVPAANYEADAIKSPTKPTGGLVLQKIAVQEGYVESYKQLLPDELKELVVSTE